MILFFGDSFTSGENNNFNGYVEKLDLKDVKNFGVSGTCIGDYSLYPVYQNNLVQLLDKEKESIKKADTIFLEYGSNDISSIICGYTSVNVVLIDFVKCLDYIRQLNSNCKIYFLTLGENVNTFASGQIEYLKNDYLKSISNLVFSASDNLKLKWISLYDEFISYVKNMELEMIEFPKFGEDELDKDGLHPNDKGYSKIANTIIKHITN